MSIQDKQPEPQTKATRSAKESIKQTLASFDLSQGQIDKLHTAMFVSEIEEHRQLKLLLNSMLVHFLDRPAGALSVRLMACREDFTEMLEELVELLENQDLADYFAMMTGFLFLFDLVLGRVGDGSLWADCARGPKTMGDEGGAWSLSAEQKIQVVNIIIEFGQNNGRILGYFGVRDWEILARQIWRNVEKNGGEIDDFLLSKLHLLSVLTASESGKRKQFMKQVFLEARSNRRSKVAKREASKTGESRETESNLAETKPQKRECRLAMPIQKQLINRQKKREHNQKQQR